MKKGLIIETKILSEIKRQRELMGLHPVLLNEENKRFPFIDDVVKWFVKNMPGSKLDDIFDGNIGNIVNRLKKKGINTIDDLEDTLVRSAAKIDSSIEKQLVKALRKKVFSDDSLREIADGTLLAYFGRLGNLPDGLNLKNIAQSILDTDLTIPEVLKAARQKIETMKVAFGSDNEAIQYFERRVNELSGGSKVDNVNTPKVDDSFFKNDEPIVINAPKPDEPNSNDLKFDFNNTNSENNLWDNLPDPEKLPDVELDFDATIRAMEFEPDVVPDTLSNLIKTMGDRTPLFKGLPPAKKAQVIEEVKSQFVLTYNKYVKDAKLKIQGDFNDPKVLAQIEKAWKSVSTSPSAKQALLDKALKESKVKLSRTSKEFWKNYFTGKSASTGADIGPKQWLKNYMQAVAISAGITFTQIVIHSIRENTNTGWDNLPGDSTGDKLYNLIKPGEAFFKASLPPFMGSILLAMGVDRLLINKYRKPSSNEVREKLLIKNEATVEVKDIPANSYKDAEYSRTVLINNINIGDWTLEIETKNLVKMKKGADIPEDAKTGSSGNAPSPAPNTTKTTMTKAEVETIATNATNGYVKPLTFTPNEDNKAEYSVTDKDGDKFKATLNNGAIVITPQ